jgi:hypothetical protein
MDLFPSKTSFLLSKNDWYRDEELITLIIFNIGFSGWGWAAGTARNPWRGVSERRGGGLPGPYHTLPCCLLCHHVNGCLMVRSPGCNGKGPSFEFRASRNRNFEKIGIFKSYSTHQTIRYTPIFSVHSYGTTCLRKSANTTRTAWARFFSIISE